MNKAVHARSRCHASDTERVLPDRNQRVPIKPVSLTSAMKRLLVQLENDRISQGARDSQQTERQKR